MYPHSDLLALATRFVLYARITGYFVRPARPRLLITAPPPAPPPTLVFGPWDGVPLHVSTLGLFSLPTPSPFMKNSGWQPRLLVGRERWHD